MQREWTPEELLEAWTLVEADWELVANKAGATRLGFALLLKFFELEARFPSDPGELPAAALAYVAAQVQVPAEQFRAYSWSGRSVTYHRAQIRAAFGFRAATREDERTLTAWLAKEMCPVELNDDRVCTALWARCRTEKLEPPGRVERIIGAARAAFEEQFCTRTVGRLSPTAIMRLEELVAADPPAADDQPVGAFALLKADPGPLGLETVLREVAKLNQLRAVGLPAELFTDVSEKLVAAWRARVVPEYPAWLRRHRRPVRLTLLATLCWSRMAEIIDALMDLFILLVNKINTSAERRVERELIADLRRVQGKDAILFALAEAAVDHPDETARRQ